MNVWRNRLHRWFAPLAARSPLSPNAISSIALVLNGVAAWLFYERQFLPGIVFITIGGLLDAFDGIVARVQGKTSAFGDFLDHFFDRISDALLVAGWMLGSGVRVELTVVALIAVTLNGYIGTQIEATWHDRNYDSVGRGEFVLGLVLYPAVSHILESNGWRDVASWGLRIADWMTILIVASAIFGIVQRFGRARHLARASTTPPSSK